MLNRTRRLLTALAAISALLAASVAAAPPAAAAPAVTVSFTVNSINDVPANFSGDPNFDTCQTGPGNQVCTLRAAIMNANRHASGPAIIHLPAGAYTLSQAPAAPFGDVNGSLDISRSVTLLGAGAASTVIDGARLDSVFFITPSGVFTVTGVTIQHGFSSFYAGGLYNQGQLSLSDSLVTSNAGIPAGGLLNSGPATINRSAFTANHSDDGGGGIFNQNTLVINTSTLAGNHGGGGGGIDNAGTLTMFDSTLSNNSVVGSGGGLLNFGTASLFHVTIAGNLAADAALGGQSGGGIDNAFSADHLQLFNTLLADNFISSTRNECSGQIASHDYNLIQTTSGCALSLSAHDTSTVTDALLGELAGNGGPTPTRALLAGSPALDQIPATHNGPCRDAAGAAPVPDQRGVARPVNGLCDIGAFEGALPLPLFGRNLVRNGDAEAGAGSPTGAWVGAPGWQNELGQFTVVTYNAPGAFPSVPTDTVPANHGANFFAGGVAPIASAFERIDVSAAGGRIDTGLVSLALSGDLGGFGAKPDDATFSVSFVNQFDQMIGLTNTLIGPVTASERHNQTGFLHRLVFGVVPASTRTIIVEVIFTRLSSHGLYDDGFADNLSLVLQPPPLWLPFVVR